MVIYNAIIITDSFEKIMKNHQSYDDEKKRSDHTFTNIKKNIHVAFIKKNGHDTI